MRAYDALGEEGGIDSGAPLAEIGRDASACAVIRRIESHLQRVVTGVTSTMRSFAGAPRRKVMLLVSGGWPRSAGEYLLGSIGPTAQLPGCKMAGPALYEPIHEVANRLGFTLYPVLAPDLPSAIDAADRASRDPLAVNSQWRFSQAQEIPVKLGGKEPPEPGQHAVYEVELEVRRERQDVVVALFDPPSGRILESKTVLAP